MHFHKRLLVKHESESTSDTASAHSAVCHCQSCLYGCLSSNILFIWWMKSKYWSQFNMWVLNILF